MRFSLATPADDAAVRRLLRENPMPGPIRIALEREPDASRAAALAGDVHHTIVARDEEAGEVIAMGSVAVREMYVNGEPTRVGYLHELRLDHRCRPRAPVIRGGYAFFRELHASLGVSLCLTSIAADNRVARRFLERGLPGMPTYRPLEPYVTCVIAARAMSLKARAGLRVDPVYLDHLPQILECLQRWGRRHQFATVWNERNLEPIVEAEAVTFLVAKRAGRVVGCVGVWDQSAYKQAVVHGYSLRLARWRGVLNAVGGYFDAPYLPPVGTTLNLAYLSQLAVDDDDPQVFAALLNAACDAGDRWMDDRGRGNFALGLAQRHPLLAVLPNSMRRIAYRTNLYAVHFEDGHAAAEALDGRVCQPEVALL